MNKALSPNLPDLPDSPDRPDALRRRLLQVSALAMTAGIALPRAFAQGAAAPGKLTLAVIGDGRTGIWASLRSGDGKRLDRELNTRIVWQPGFTASLPVMEALRAGGVDFTFATATAVVNAVAANVPIVPLSAYALPANEVDLLVPTASSVKTAADLRGKTIAHQNGTTGTYSLIKYLESGGLRLSDVKAVSLSGADAFTALAQGSVDAWIHWQPATALALAKLGGRVRAVPGVKTYDYAFYVARADVAAKHPQTLAKLVRLLRDTQAAILAKPDEAVAAWAAQGGFDAGGVEQRVYRQLIVDQRLSDSGAVSMRPVDAAAAASTQDLADNFFALGVLPTKTDVRSFLLSPKWASIQQTVAAELGA